MSEENPEVNLEYSRRGWKIASIGLLFSFNIFILGPLGMIDIFFLVIIGTPIAFTGLIISIKDKRRVGKDGIFAEIVVLIILAMNAYVWLTMGTIGR